VFDQTRADLTNRHTISLDDGIYDRSDSDMQRILHRLTAAAASVDMRQDMMVEDEYYSIIKEQESKLYYGERKLAEMNAQLKEKDGQIAEKEGQLAEKDNQLAEKESQLQTSIKLLLNMGQTKEAIARSLNISIAEIDRLCQ
jgi:uncharacterized protein (DUF3084 family)